MRRWLIRIFAALGVLIVVLVIAVQGVLWSQLPKNLVVKQIEKSLGLRISTDRLTTGWLGRTTLTNVSLSLPLAQKSFLTVATLKVKHTTLLGMVFGQAVSVQSIELDQPHVIVLQSATGEWNLAEVSQLLAAAGGGTTATESSQQTGIPKLPMVKLLDGTIDVIDNQKHHATFSPLNVNGNSRDALVWQYNATIADSIKITGVLAPGGNWKHQVKLIAQNLDPLVKEWGISTYGADVAGEWDGQVDSGKVTGTLTLDHATATAVPAAGNVSASGAVDVEVGGPATTIRPRKISLKTSLAFLPNLDLAAGAISSDSTGLHVDSVKVSAMGGLADLKAQYDPNLMSADVAIRWTGLTLSNNINHSGALTASLRMPFAKHPVIKLDLASNGTASFGKWDTDIAVTGAGQSWKSIDWLITAPKFNLSGAHPLSLSQLSGHISQRWPDVQLADFTILNHPHLSARGDFNAETGQWYLYCESGGAQKLGTTVMPLSLTIDAWGKGSLYALKALNLQVAQACIWAGGFYDSSKPNPMNVDVFLTQTPQLAADAPVQGHVGGKFKVSGWLGHNLAEGEHLKITGDLSSSDLVILNRPVGDIDVKLDGAMEGYDTRVQTREMILFGGRWEMSVFGPNSDHDTEIKLSVRDLPVQELANFANITGATGTLESANWTFEFPSLDPNRITMDSEYAFRQIQYGGIAIPRIEAKATLKDGTLAVTPLRAVNGTGILDTQLSMDLTNPRFVQTKFQLNNWPLATGGGSVVSVSAASDLAIDLKTFGAVGSLNSTADLILNDTSLAHADLVAQLQGRVLNISKISGDVLNGSFAGNAIVDVDKPLQASGQLNWFDIDAATLTKVSPGIAGLSGKYSGTITMAPARDPRPLAPVRIDINMATDHARFRSMDIGGTGLVALHGVAYANLDRFVLDHCTLDLAGGQLQMWARMGRSSNSQQAIIDFNQLDLDELAHISPTIKSSIPGRLAGHIELIGSGANIEKLLGNARIQLTQTDLGNFGPIASLYNAMNVGSSKSGPSGAGSVELSFEQNTLKVNTFEYFNRGIDAHGIASVGRIDWNNVSAAKINGQVVGTARPLKDSRISLLATFDQAFTAIQSSLTPIAIGGTLGNPTYAVQAVGDIGDILRQALVGEARDSSP